MPGFGQVQGEVATAVAGGPGSDADEVAADGVDRPGDLGGSDPWKDAESCLHSGSTPMSCASAQ